MVDLRQNWNVSILVLTFNAHKCISEKKSYALLSMVVLYHNIKNELTLSSIWISWCDLMLTYCSDIDSMDFFFITMTFWMVWHCRSLPLGLSLGVNCFVFMVEQTFTTHASLARVVSGITYHSICVSAVVAIHPCPNFNSLGYCKKYVPALVMYQSYIFLALTYRTVV